MTTSPTTDAVKAFAAIHFTVSKKQVRDNLGLTVDQASSAFDNLVRQGCLRRISHGLYQFVEAVEKPPVEIVDKIWRAMKISGSFSAADIARLAESSTAYVYKRFRQYKADGYLKDAGTRPSYGSGTEKLWRLTLKGKEKAQSPNVEIWTPDPLQLAAVNLNRLVCSGVAMRDKEAAMEAMGQLNVIRKGLKGVIDES